MRRIISLWFPRFATDRISQRHPGWRSEPLVTVRHDDVVKKKLGHVNRSLGMNFIRTEFSVRVAEANKVAEFGKGITSGLLLTDARARFPKLRVVSIEDYINIAALTELANWCDQWTPRVSLDVQKDMVLGKINYGLWLDITGCAHLFGNEITLMKDILKRLENLGFEVCAALADTQGAAWAVAHYGEKDEKGSNCGKIIESGEVRAALSTLSIQALRLSPEDIKGLNNLGFQEIKDLYNIPRNALAQRFNQNIVCSLDKALGLQNELFLPHRPTRKSRVQKNFDNPISNRSSIITAVRWMLGKLLHLLELQEKGVRNLELSLYRVEGKVERIEVMASYPVRDASHLIKLLRNDLDELNISFGFDSMVLATIWTQHLAPIQLFLNSEIGSIGSADISSSTERVAKEEYVKKTGIVEEKLARLIDRLRNKLGFKTVYCPKIFASYLPERTVLCSTKFDFITSVKFDCEFYKRRHPLRLLPSPEEIKKVIIGTDSIPKTFYWRGRTHYIMKFDGPERICNEWWRAEYVVPSSSKKYSFRDYYRIENDQGMRFWVYQDSFQASDSTSVWKLHGIFG